MSTGIQIRNLRFSLRREGIEASRRNDGTALAFYASLSAMFPEGERFFVQAVRRLAAHADGRLAEEVRAFGQQEGHHSREHTTFNSSLESAGVPMDRLVARTDAQVARGRRATAVRQLGSTAGLEHFTAIFAEQLLRKPKHLAFADAETRALWRWHAIEEIEHKSVAFDLFMRATAHWNPVRRWIYRCWVMLDSVTRMLIVVAANMRDVMETREPGSFSYRELARFFFIRPGLGRMITLDTLAFFMPWFHPSQLGDAKILAAARAEFDAHAEVDAGLPDADLTDAMVDALRQIGRDAASTPQAGRVAA